MLNKVKEIHRSSVVTANARPFLKWAGGKTQLLDELHMRLPPVFIENGEIQRYVEPFVGGGALFFFLKKNFKVKTAFLLDINKELIVGYWAIQRNVNELIDELRNVEEMYLKLPEHQRKAFYYRMRDGYNRQRKEFDYSNYSPDWIKRAVYLIFLNKTCYNGLFRLNRKGEFNVPFGRYKKPVICDEENLIKVSKALADTQIICGDFEESRKYIQANTLVYLDPPYRPLNDTSSFTGYSEDGFFDHDQVRLAHFFKEMDKRGAYLMLSNSDPKNRDQGDDFFDRLYEGFVIERVKAKRNINSNAHKRGDITELIIRNYK